MEWSNVNYMVLNAHKCHHKCFGKDTENCAIITYKHGIYELPHELPNDLRLRILGNSELSGKCLNFIE